MPKAEASPLFDRRLARTTVEDAVKRALGSRALERSRAELAADILRFVDAGTAALHAQPDTAREGARLVDAAKRALSAGRRTLASSTSPGAPAIIVAPEWRLLQAALRKHRERLLAYPGVVGVGLGYRRRGPHRTRERCVVVFVQRKSSPARLKSRARARIPGTLRVGRSRVPTDVVEFGKLSRHHLGGDGLGPTQRREMGTLGVFASDATTGAPVALTAMHVTGRREFPPGSATLLVSPSTLEPNSAPFGRLLRGTMRGIDAAAIQPDRPDLVEHGIRGIGPVNGWRPLSHPGDQGTLVQMFGARTGQRVFGRIVETFVDLPEHDLDAVFLVDITSANGDSGAAIVDNEGFVLGLLVGESSRLNNLRIFTPISSVLARLACDIPTREAP